MQPKSGKLSSITFVVVVVLVVEVLFVVLFFVIDFADVLVLLVVFG